MRRLYDWVLSWAESKWAAVALFLLAMAEASFFPVPPDVLLIALVLSMSRKAWFYAALCTAGSALGGVFGYLIGWQLMEVIGFPILNFYGAMNSFETVQALFRQYDVWIVGIAGFTPIPYKVFTITAGATLINFPAFIVTSILSRGARFFLVAGLIYFFGPKIKTVIDKYFNLLTIVFAVLLIGGFVVVKLVLN
ncbi:YqaA family protein [candidate division KSB1 bacterium]